MFIYILLLAILCYIRELNARFNKKLYLLKIEQDKFEKLNSKLDKLKIQVQDSITQRIGLITRLETLENLTKQLTNQFYNHSSKIGEVVNRLELVENLTNKFDDQSHKFTDKLYEFHERIDMIERESVANYMHKTGEQQKNDNINKLYYFFNTLCKFQKGDYYYPVPPNCQAVNGRVCDKDKLQKLYDYYKENDILCLVSKYVKVVNDQLYYGEIKHTQDDIYETKASRDCKFYIPYNSLECIWQYSLFDGLLSSLLLNKTITENVRKKTSDFINNPNCSVNDYSPNKFCLFQVAYGYPEKCSRQMIDQIIKDAITSQSK